MTKSKMMDADFAPGDRLGERYQIVEPLGNGGFAQVYRGIQLGMNRPVAIKVMAPKLGGIKASNHDAALADFSRRFEKEAQVLSTLHDASTVTVHDYGITPEGISYMILELVEGTSLAQLASDELPMPAQRVARIMLRVLESLREAHFLGILHRDIKPSNIMIFSRMGEHDQVKVLDFGMAKIYQGEPTTDLAQDTQDGMLIGTPRYMAPELIREPSKACPASDLYSLGMVTYELLTGERAIPEAEIMLQISRQLDDTSLTLPSSLVVLPALRTIVDGLLDKNLETRWHDAQHVINAITQKVLPYLQSTPPAATRSAPSTISAILPPLASAPKPAIRPPNPLLAALSSARTQAPRITAPHPVVAPQSEELEEDDASTITLTEELVVSTVSTIHAPPKRLAPAKVSSLFDQDADAMASPASGVRMPSRPVLQSSGILPAPPSHSVARPLRATAPSQPLAVQDPRLRKRMDSSHNVAAPVEPLPLSWDDNEVTPLPAQPDRAERVIVLDAPSGRHPVSEPSADPSTHESAAPLLQDMDQKWIAVQRRNQMLSALLLLVVLAITLYVIVQYLL